MFKNSPNHQPLQWPSDKDIAIANFNATLFNAGVNFFILSCIQEQLALNRKSVEQNAKFHAEVIKLLKER